MLAYASSSALFYPSVAVPASWKVLSGVLLASALKAVEDQRLDGTKKSVHPSFPPPSLIPSRSVCLDVSSCFPPSICLFLYARLAARLKG